MLIQDTNLQITSIPMPSAPSPLFSNSMNTNRVVDGDPRGLFGLGLQGSGCHGTGIKHTHAYWTAEAMAVHFQRWKSAM